ncbi:hypothetical protein VNO80_33900 [Phaseolus coccineus]|uniref:Uncharacterized protein n=1 Tax=Phaseolus coccineus TaxID=3886 RepID=A0AAN9L2N7_PHACN
MPSADGRQSEKQNCSSQKRSSKNLFTERRELLSSFPALLSLVKLPQVDFDRSWSVFGRASKAKAKAGKRVHQDQSSPDGVGVNLPSTGLSDSVSLRQDTGRSGLSSFRVFDSSNEMLSDLSKQNCRGFVEDLWKNAGYPLPVLSLLASQEKSKNPRFTTSKTENPMIEESTAGESKLCYNPSFAPARLRSNLFLLLGRSELDLLNHRLSHELLVELRVIDGHLSAEWTAASSWRKERSDNGLHVGMPLRNQNQTSVKKAYWLSLLEMLYFPWLRCQLGLVAWSSLRLSLGGGMGAARSSILIRVNSWESLLPPISGVTVTFFLKRLLDFERAVGIAKLYQMRDRDFLLMR